MEQRRRSGVVGEGMASLQRSFGEGDGEATPPGLTSRPTEVNENQFAHKNSKSHAANSRRSSTERCLRMEFPSFNHHHHHHHHHQNRYVPPPPPTNFSDERPNLYPHHQHLLPSLHLPPPPPLAYPSLPPPPPPPLPVPPPPPSYNPHQSNFTFLDAQSPSFFNNGRSSPPQPRLSNQSQRFVYRTDSWSDSHRVPTELSHRNPILPDDHHRRLYSPDSRSENHYKPHVSERGIPSSRYRDEAVVNGYASRDASNIVSQEQQVFRGSSSTDDHHARNIDRYASAQATGSSSRNLEEFVEKYEPRYITNSESERVWDHHGEDPRWSHQVKGKKNESGREQSRDYEYESSRVSRVREGREEFKQVQKKSVLLRIGKPNNTNSRNRSHDQHFSKAHMVESNSSNFRGKDKDRDHASKDGSLYVDHRMEGDREHSPVELDVSFKSNALVAKAVSPVIDNNSHKNKKTKRATEFDSPLKRSGSSDCPSSSEKPSKQQKVDNDAPVLGQGGGAIVGPLSFKLKKKKKVNNFKSSLSVSIFQLAEKDNKSVNGPTASIPSTSKKPISSKVDEVKVSDKDSSEVEKVSKINNLRQQSSSENEVSLNQENDTTDAKFQESFPSSAEITTIYPENASVKVQETSTSGCSDEIITENGVSRKEEEPLLLQFLEDDPQNAISISEDVAVVISGESCKGTEIQSVCENALPNPSKVVSIDEDEFVDIIELNAESIETERPDPSTDLPLKDDLSILSDDKSGEEQEPMPSIISSEKVSGFIKDQTISNSNSSIISNNDGNVCVKAVETSKTGIKPNHLDTKTATSASQGLTTKIPIKKPNSVSTVLPTRSSPVFTNSRMTTNPSKSIVKPRTWHRSLNNNAMASVPRPQQIGTFQNAYIRSGNSLVRKGSPVLPSRSSIYQLNPVDTRTGAVVRPKTPPLSAATTTTTTTTTKLPEVLALEDQKTSLGVGKMTEYVKPKSNQLVAATASSGEKDKTTQVSSDGYYKRRKNQLIRTLKGDDDSAINIKRQSGKGISKKYRNLRGSSVWTLGAQKLRPHLFPWKRSKYSSNSSSSLIRKREMVYTRSKHGFSLRMSKLLSIGGSSLKWSKSIEKNSKRANEEATLAVAAAEKKRREQHLNSNEIKRDRIFRIGLVRYKMDPSRRTLQRISDESPSTSQKSKDEIRKSYVPKRLLIGHDEYVDIFYAYMMIYLRIGNGNQLVRNPKRRTRLFANEKVRWSLHTARSRLARKKKYCQFFTRFGKCNKDDGKCQYIHDPSKIAVCTKFLKGLCSNPDCKLTHKVIPERMQDCSYFLQGLCSNEHCPYRHVNVNTAASVCEDFLKGYCADGNECRKKHTYTCPVFEATGECSQATKCKLHHPKNRNRNRKPQNSTPRHLKNSKGRYFGGAVSGGNTIPLYHKKDDDLCQQPEFISLDFGDLEDVMVIDNDQTTMVTGDPLEATDDLDDLTKPIRIMKNVKLRVVS
ncbi:hypothetical protein LXL04_007709 [Taraxacum kok-saghyz]